MGVDGYGWIRIDMMDMIDRVDTKEYGTQDILGVEKHIYELMYMDVDAHEADKQHGGFSIGAMGI